MTLTGQKIELFVADLASSVDFYCRVLGFEAGPQRQVMLDGNELHHVPVWNGPILIGLGLLSRLDKSHHLRRGGLDAERGIGVEICLYVDDAELDAYYQRVERECQAGIEALVNQPWGSRDFRVVDPDGYYVRVSSPDRDYRALRLEPL